MFILKEHKLIYNKLIYIILFLTVKTVKIEAFSWNILNFILL